MTELTARVFILDMAPNARRDNLRNLPNGPIAWHAVYRRRGSAASTVAGPAHQAEQHTVAPFASPTHEQAPQHAAVAPEELTAPARRRRHRLPHQSPRKNVSREPDRASARYDGGRSE